MFYLFLLLLLLLLLSLLYDNDNDDDGINRNDNLKYYVFLSFVISCCYSTWFVVLCLAVFLSVCLFICLGFVVL